MIAIDVKVLGNAVHSVALPWDLNVFFKQYVYDHFRTRKPFCSVEKIDFKDLK